MSNFWRPDHAEGSSDARKEAWKKWDREHIDTSKETVPPASNILSECPKFRVLIIGGTGVGKSTICSLVFNIDGESMGVSRNQRGDHDINVPWEFKGVNERIIIHDSKGFEKGDESTFTEVINFIDKKKRAVTLAEQLHCIWYCISCGSEVRTLQKTEEDFFRNLEAIVGKIPVIVVFTQFDLIIKAVYAEWMAKNRKRLARNMVTEQTMYQEIRDTATKRFNKLYNEQWSKVINRFHVPFLRMANPPAKKDDDNDSANDVDDDDNELRTLCPEIGVEALTKITLDNLENHNIKILWAAAQNNSADLTSRQSISVGMEYFNITMAMNVVPFIPVVSGITFFRAFTNCFSKISPLWNLIDERKLLFQSSVRNKFICAIFDSSTWGFLALQAIDVLGFFDAPATASVLAKAIGGIVLVHDILFVMQKEQWGDNKRIQSLTMEQIDAVLTEFRRSPLRGVMMASIGGSSLFAKCYSKDDISELIFNAIDLARSKHPRTALTKGTLK